MEKINQFLINYPILEKSILSNKLGTWILACLIFFVVLMVLKVFKEIIVYKLKKISDKTNTQIDDIVIKSIVAIHWSFYILIAIYFSLSVLTVGQEVSSVFNIVFLIAAVYYVIIFVQNLLGYGLEKTIEKKESSGDSAGILGFLKSLLNIFLWIGGIVLILSNLGYNVTSLVAGLGIGGIAVALALQNILGDLFSSLTIFFDKPFKIGDFIVVGDKMGTVTKVGIKSSRLNLLQGEELVVSNSELTSSQIRNFGKLKRRRISFSLGVTYDTPADKLEEIPKTIKDIIEKQEKTEFDRAHFSSFGDFSLNFDVVYYINSAEYVDYMTSQQNINLDIVRKFEEKKIEMAFPTQTVYENKG